MGWVGEVMFLLLRFERVGFFCGGRLIAVPHVMYSVDELVTLFTMHIYALLAAADAAAAAELI
jgi:hypothetical protein